MNQGKSSSLAIAASLNESFAGAGWYNLRGVILYRLDPGAVKRFTPPCNVLNREGSIYRLTLDQPVDVKERVRPGRFFRLSEDFLMRISFGLERGRNFAANMVRWPEGTADHIPLQEGFTLMESFEWPTNERQAEELNELADEMLGWRR